jgi:quercetin dioxygenase-like cupin family protein
MLDHLDAIAASPEHHKILLENSQIRVLETLILPGETTRVHTHIWSGYLYVLEWSDFQRLDPEGNVLMDSTRMANTPVPGTALWSEPLEPHSLRNVGNQNIHVIMTEFKTLPEVR